MAPRPPKRPRKRPKPVRRSTKSRRRASRTRARNTRGAAGRRRTTERSLVNAARVRALAAINRVRRGKSPTLAAAAKAEHTTMTAIRRWVPSALGRDRRGRLRVRTSDRYVARVEVLTDDGLLDVTAHGSRERELAGRHRAVWGRVLRGELPPTALAEFHGKTVGGHELVSDPDRLATLLKGGALDRLHEVYVSPETR